MVTTVTIKEFQRRMFFYLKNLPVDVTSKGEVIASITSPTGIHVPSNRILNQETYKPPILNKLVTNCPPTESKLDVAREALRKAEDKAFNGVVEETDLTDLVSCDKCNQMSLEVFPHWEDGQDFKVCEYCKKRIKRP